MSMHVQWCRAVWKEGGVEEEGVIPSNWIVGKHVLWPTKEKNEKKAILEKKEPNLDTWSKFELVKTKITSESKKECEDHNLTTSTELSEEEDTQDNNGKRKPKKKNFSDFLTGDFSDEPCSSRSNKPLKTTSVEDLPPPPVPPKTGKGKCDKGTAATGKKSSRARSTSPVSQMQSRKQSPNRPKSRNGSQKVSSITPNNQKRYSTHSNTDEGRSPKDGHSGNNLRINSSRSPSPSLLAQSRTPLLETYTGEPSVSHKRTSKNPKRDNNDDRFISCGSKEKLSKNANQYQRNSRSRSTSMSSTRHSCSPYSSYRSRSPARRSRSISMQSRTFPMLDRSLNSSRSPSPSILGHRRTPSLDRYSRRIPNSQKSVPRREKQSRSTCSSQNQRTSMSTSRSQNTYSNSQYNRYRSRSPARRSRSPARRSRTPARRSRRSRSRSVSRHSRTESRFPMSDAKYQKRSLYLLVEIRDLLKQRLNNPFPGSFQLREFDPEQMESIDEFVDFENSLTDKEKYVQCKTLVGRIGGSDFKDHTKKAMKRLMTNRLMAQMNMKGKKNKFAFGDSSLFKLIKEAVTACYDCTEEKIKEVAANYLKYAPERVGGGGRREID